MRVSLNVVNALFAYAAERGFDAEAVLAAAGLSPMDLETSDERLPSSVLFGMHRALDTLTHEDTWALGVVGVLPKGSYGIAEYIFRSQPSLLDSFHAIVRYSCERAADAFRNAFAAPELVARVAWLSEGMRVELPEQRVPLEISLGARNVCVMLGVISG